MKKKLVRHIASDFILSAVALVIFNGAIQLFIYPSIENKLGEEKFGVALFVFAVISIMASTFGTAANYSRMVQSTKGHDRNGDYNIFLLGTLALSIPVSIVISVIEGFSVLSAVLLVALMWFTILRFYGDAQFKLTINYKGYFLFYLAATAGYFIGLYIFKLSGSWIAAILAGEMLAAVFVLFSGKLYRRPLFKPSEYFKETMRSIFVLCGANIFPALILNSDRLLIKPILGDASVTEFYLASLVGKTISFITTPLNGVLIGYLSKYKGKFSRKLFGLLALGTTVLGLVATAVCTLGAYIFVMWKYPDKLADVKQYFIVANAGQVFYFLSNSLMVIVLRYADEKYQTYINIAYAVLFAVCVPASTWFGGMWGFAISLLVVNASKMAIVTIVGLAKLDSRAALHFMEKDDSESIEPIQGETEKTISGETEKTISGETENPFHVDHSEPDRSGTTGQKPPQA